MNLVAFRNKISSLIFGQHPILNPGGLVAYRILFGLINVFYARNTFDRFDLLFSPATIEGYWVLKSLIFLWFALGIAITVSRPGKLFLFVHYLISAYILTKNLGIHSVECKFFIAASFFNLFLPFNEKSTFSPHAYKAIVLALISYSGYLFFGGFVSKASDPIWSHGLGFYKVMLLPWIKSPILNFLTDHYQPSLICNYIVIAVEALIFPLAVFSATRKYAILLFASFAFFLFFVLRISAIGVESFALSLLFFSVFPIRIKFLALFEHLTLSEIYLPGFQKVTRFIAARYRSAEPHFLRLLFFFMALLVVRHSISVFNHQYLYNGKFTLIDRLNSVTFCMHYDHLFTAMHLDYIEEYRVIVRMKDGRVLEPIKVFGVDKTAEKYTGSFFSSRWLQAEMYRTNRKVISSYFELHRVPPDNVLRIFKFIKGKCGPESEVESMHLITSQLFTPDEFRENAYSFMISDKWREVLRYYPQTEKFKLLTAD